MPYCKQCTKQISFAEYYKYNGKCKECSEYEL